MKENILVSCCLAGFNTKYSGGNNYKKEIENLKEKYNFIYICPESDGGLKTPRNPSEITPSGVFSNKGVDVTINFNKGAQIALDIAKRYNVKKALLKEASPSCGKNVVYDGTFTGNKIKGQGITAKLLLEHGIEVYTENEIDLL